MAMLCTGGISFLQQLVTAEITRIAVPLFFLISGFLFFINYNGTLDDYKRKLRSRTQSLFIPYIIFMLCGCIIIYIIGKVYTIDAFYGIIKKGILHNPPIFYPLWFLRDLYIMVLFAPLVYIVVRKVPVLIVFIFVIWVLGKNPFIFPCTETMLFFSIGAYLTTKEKFLEQRKHKGTWLLFSFWLFSCFLNTYICKYVISLPYATHCIILILGIYTIWILYDKLYPKFSERIKNAPIYKYSFLIYLIHEPILTIIKKLGLYILGTSSYSIGIIYVIATLLTILITYFIGCKLSTYFPSFLSIITGGRFNR
jgi:surface polysaccharide O-acyltransferase-like enzyme